MTARPSLRRSPPTEVLCMSACFERRIRAPQRMPVRASRVKQLKDALSVACDRARERGRTPRCAGRRRPDQNGAVIEHNTKIGVTGCAAVKSFKAKKPTLKQQLAKALAKCRSTDKHNAKKRARCERSAHAHYTAMALAVCRRSDKHAKKAKLHACEAAARRAYAAGRASRR